MKELAWAAYHEVPPGMEPGLEAINYYDPPNMTFPFGAYICVMDIDVDTGVAKVRRFYALDDCGTRINPMIIEGQIHGGLTEAFGIAMGQEIHYDEDGNVNGAPSWTISCRPRSRRRTGRPTGPRRPRRITRSAPRASARAPMSAACRLLQCRERRLRVPGLDPHPDAARSLAHLDGRGELGLHG